MWVRSRSFAAALALALGARGATESPSLSHLSVAEAACEHRNCTRCDVFGGESCACPDGGGGYRCTAQTAITCPAWCTACAGGDDGCAASVQRSSGRVFVSMGSWLPCPSWRELEHVTHLVTVYGHENLREKEFTDACRWGKGQRQPSDAACGLSAASPPLPCSTFTTEYGDSLRSSGRKLLLAIGTHNLGRPGARAVHGWPCDVGSVAGNASLLQTGGRWRYDGILFDGVPPCPSEATAAVLNVSADEFADGTELAVMLNASAAGSLRPAPGVLTVLAFEPGAAPDAAVAAAVDSLSGAGRSPCAEGDAERCAQQQVVLGYHSRGSVLYGTPPPPDFSLDAATRNVTAAYRSVGGVMFWVTWGGGAATHADVLWRGSWQRHWRWEARPGLVRTEPADRPALPADVVGSCSLLDQADCLGVCPDCSHDCPAACAAVLLPESRPPAPAPAPRPARRGVQAVLRVLAAVVGVVSVALAWLARPATPAVVVPAQPAWPPWPAWLARPRLRGTRLATSPVERAAPAAELRPFTDEDDDAP
eukprot:TRINITY_DN4830_c0_g1_i1.p1 TRINITY_DN4830_c0_g1~~TRINITY_DN4830_c0_g1_i1.p1  ORF type:complete len:536 (+),score=181.52 TRINITY_DN4830_c0_g1_i1:47-1654(+)